MNYPTTSQRSPDRTEIRHYLQATHGKSTTSIRPACDRSPLLVLRVSDQRQRIRIARAGRNPRLENRICSASIRESAPLAKPSSEGASRVQRSKKTSSIRPRSMKFSILGSAQRMVAGVGLMRARASTRRRVRLPRSVPPGKFPAPPAGQGPPATASKQPAMRVDSLRCRPNPRWPASNRGFGPRAANGDWR